MPCSAKINEPLHEAETKQKRFQTEKELDSLQFQWDAVQQCESYAEPLCSQCEKKKKGRKNKSLLAAVAVWLLVLFIIIYAVRLFWGFPQFVQ